MSRSTRIKLYQGPVIPDVLIKQPVELVRLGDNRISEIVGPLSGLPTGLIGQIPAGLTVAPTPVSLLFSDSAVTDYVGVIPNHTLHQEIAWVEDPGSGFWKPDYDLTDVIQQIQGVALLISRAIAIPGLVSDLINAGRRVFVDIFRPELPYREEIVPGEEGAYQLHLYVGNESATLDIAEGESRYTINAIEASSSAMAETAFQIALGRMPAEKDYLRLLIDGKHPHFQVVADELTREEARRSIKQTYPLTMPVLTSIVENDTGRSVIHATLQIPGTVSWRGEKINPDNPYALIELKLKRGGSPSREAQIIEMEAAQTFSELARAIGRFDTDVFDGGKVMVRNEAARLILAMFHKVRFRFEIWDYHRIPKLFRDKLISLLREYDAKVRVILAEQYDAPIGMFKERSIVNEYETMAWHLAQYSRLVGDEKLDGIDRRYQRAVSRNAARLRNFIGDVGIDWFEEPLLAVDLYRLFHRYKGRNFEISASDIDFVRSMDRQFRDGLIDLASFFPRPVEMLRLLYTYRDGKRELYSSIGQHMKKVNGTDLGPFQDLIQFWHEAVPDLLERDGIDQLFFLLASRQWDRLATLRLLPTDAIWHVLTQEALDAFTGTGEAITDYLREIMIYKDGLNEEVVDASAVDIDAHRFYRTLQMVRKLGLSILDFNKAYVNSRTFFGPEALFFGGVSWGGIIESFVRRTRFLSRLNPEGREQFDLGQGVTLSIGQGRHEAKHGIGFSLAIDREGEKYPTHLIVMGATMTGETINITHLQGGKRVRDVDREKFHLFSGGLDPIPWIAAFVGKLLLQYATENNLQLRFIDGSLLKMAYPHVLHDIVVSQKDAQRYLDQPRGRHPAVAVNLFHDEPQDQKTTMRHNSFEREWDRGLHTINLYRNTARQLGFRRRKNQDFWYWPAGKGLDDMGRALFNQRGSAEESGDSAIDVARIATSVESALQIITNVFKEKGILRR